MFQYNPSEPNLCNDCCNCVGVPTFVSTVEFSSGGLLPISFESPIRAYGCGETLTDGCTGQPDALGIPQFGWKLDWPTTNAAFLQNARAGCWMPFTAIPIGTAGHSPIIDVSNVAQQSRSVTVTREGYINPMQCPALGGWYVMGTFDYQESYTLRQRALGARALFGLYGCIRRKNATEMEVILTAIFADYTAYAGCLLIRGTRQASQTRFINPTTCAQNVFPPSTGFYATQGGGLYGPGNCALPSPEANGVTRDDCFFLGNVTTEQCQSLPPLSITMPQGIVCAPTSAKYQTRRITIPLDCDIQKTWTFTEADIFNGVGCSSVQSNSPNTPTLQLSPVNNFFPNWNIGVNNTATMRETASNATYNAMTNTLASTTVVSEKWKADWTLTLKA